MRITRIGLTDFKTHRALDIEPAAGVTVIRGPNESGKSSIQQAIELVLFRKADANRDDIRKAWAWGSASPPQVVLDFESESGTGRLLKRFGGPRSEGVLTLAGRSTADHALIADQVAELTGIPTESFFRATASVGHAELDVVGGDEPVIGDRLQKAISGADWGTAKAKKKLETAIHRYRTEGHKNPGLLKLAREEIVALEAELAEGEGSLARLQSDRAQWVEAHERREELDATLERQEADLAEMRRAAGLARRRDEAQERYERLKRGVELSIEAERLQRDLPTGMPLPQLRTSVSRLDSLQFEISELEAEISVSPDAGDGNEPEVTPARPMTWLALAAIFVVLGWLASFFLSDAGIIGVVAIAGLAIGVIVALVQSVRGAGRRRRYGLAMQLAEAATAQRAEAESEMHDQFRRKRREFETTLAEIGVPDVAAAEKLLASAEEQTEAFARVDGELRGLGVGRRGIRSLEEERDQAANEAAQAGHALNAMGNLLEDPVAAEAATQRLVAQTRPARDLARSEEDRASGRVEANGIDAEVVAALAERLAAARERQTELQRRVMVYEGTLEAIGAAEQATLKTAARYLEERMGPTISAITDGRYDEIEVDEKTLAFKVRAPESGELVDVSQLSQGTADQLFLAARLGLVRLVTMDRRPPLILDDPFVTFDAARGKRALRVVKQFAHEHGFQVLYLTCSDRFDDLADELVVLPGPSQERVLAMSKQTPPDPVTAAPETVQATLRFEPDPRPGPRPDAPFSPASDAPTGAKPDAPSATQADPRPAPRPDAPEAPRSGAAATPRTGQTSEPDPLEALRQAAKDASEAERDTGVRDPFRIGDSDGNGAAG